MKPVIITGPSGVGKGTLIKQLKKDFGANLLLSTSHTTRCPRAHEINAVDYFFISKTEFSKMIEQELFVEYTVYNNEFYGTSKEQISHLQNTVGRIPIIEIELEGVLNLIKTFGSESFYLVCILPTNIEELKKRLVNRGTDSEEAIARRLDRARIEMEHYKDINFNMQISNEKFENAYEQLTSALNQWWTHSNITNKS